MAEHVLAVLVDFENMARPGAKSRGDFDINLVLSRLAEKGRVVVKRAYADWSRYREAKMDLQNAGLELIEMPSAREGAKNRADIKLAVDAMELKYLHVLLMGEWVLVHHGVELVAPPCARVSNGSREPQRQVQRPRGRATS